MNEKSKFLCIIIIALRCGDSATTSTVSGMTTPGSTSNSTAPGTTTPSTTPVASSLGNGTAVRQCF